MTEIIERNRCSWCGNDPIYVKYHDKEWGVPVHSDKKLFEFLMLEGAQAGLSWITVLKKRAAYREAFDHFDFNKVARYNARKIQSLLKNPGIIRNRLKIHSAVQNANAFIEVRKEFGTFNHYIWGFVDAKPIQNKFKQMSDLPAKTGLSDTISKDLKKRGFNFVGSTIVYAHMQATGMVNDHVTGCFRYQDIKNLS
ncbi:MAG: DNA-3-methyladenine glycosylase I [Gammaproteobacteria bacterium]|nr:DNA-3-methyladenine glycosylase I [Gammaproteobacteria bacterium]